MDIEKILSENRYDYVGKNAEDLQGKTFSKVYRSTNDDANDAIIFVEDDGFYVMTHQQSCCERVNLTDVYGDLEDLVDTPIIVSEERSNSEEEDYGCSSTYTFYTIRTIKGTVDLRWHGSSNGYYSESVDLLYWKVEKE